MHALLRLTAEFIPDDHNEEGCGKNSVYEEWQRLLSSFARIGAVTFDDAAQSNACTQLSGDVLCEARGTEGDKSIK